MNSQLSLKKPGKALHTLPCLIQSPLTQLAFIKRKPYQVKDSDPHRLEIPAVTAQFVSHVDNDKFSFPSFRHSRRKDQLLHCRLETVMV